MYNIVRKDIGSNYESHTLYIKFHQKGNRAVCGVGFGGGIVLFRAAGQSIYRLYRFPNACDFVLPYGGYGGIAENRRF